jgi:lysophospholipase L1-like esterase
MKSRRRLAIVFVVTVVAGCAVAQGKDPQWVSTWITANVASDQPVSFSNQTIREIVHPSIGGSVIRIRLSNVFGSRTIRFDAVHAGLQKEGAAVKQESDREVTFGGNRWISIPEGADALSDPITLAIEAQSNLAITLFTSGETGPATVHPSAFQTNYISESGNFAADQNGAAFSKTTGSWFFLSGVDVMGAKGGAVVALGDSITDGAASRPDKNERWTDVLARRLQAEQIDIAVLNAGIGGNRVLTSSPCWGVNALARLERDVLSRTGVEAVILFEGTNDIGQPDTLAPANFVHCLSKTQVTADEIIAGYKQIIAQVHARGLRIFGGTILPYQGFVGWTAAGEAKRTAVNQWIRSAGAFDRVIDFDAVLRNSANPAQMAPAYDSGDHLHPNPAGQEALGKAVNLEWFR